MTRTCDLLVRSFSLTPYIVDSYVGLIRFLPPLCVSPALIEPRFEPSPLNRAFVLAADLGRFREVSVRGAAPSLVVSTTPILTLNRRGVGRAGSPLANTPLPGYSIRSFVSRPFPGLQSREQKLSSWFAVDATTGIRSSRLERGPSILCGLPIRQLPLPELL